jgi:hypothetical protein
MANLTEEEFSKQVGTQFQTALGEREVNLTLAEVKGYMPQVNEQEGLERFSAYFDGPPEVPLPQQIYRLRHTQMGDVELFLVPISGDR